MTFNSEFHPKFKKFVEKLDGIAKSLINSAVNKLESDPFPRGCIKIEGSVEGYENEKIFRIRMGDYRILYVVKLAENKIIFARIDRRDKVYE